MRPCVEKLCKLIEKGSIVSDGVYKKSFVRTGEFEIEINDNLQYSFTIAIRNYNEINHITIYQDECDLITKTINKLKEKQGDELINFLTKIP
jgi:hypothetical protein